MMISSMKRAEKRARQEAEGGSGSKRGGAWKGGVVKTPSGSSEDDRWEDFLKDARQNWKG